MNKKDMLLQYAKFKSSEMKYWAEEYRKRMLMLLKNKGIPLTIDSIPEIINVTSFEQVKSNPDASPCPYYRLNQPCCRGLDTNCFLCPCPEYDSDFSELIETPEGILIGRCRINNPKGRYIFHPGMGNIGLWDCSECSHNHNPKAVEKYLKEYIKEI